MTWDWDIIIKIIVVILPVILSHLGIKGYQHKKAKNNGGTMQDKLHRIETNGKIREVKIKDIIKTQDEIKKDIKNIYKELSKKDK